MTSDTGKKILLCTVLLFGVSLATTARASSSIWLQPSSGLFPEGSTEVVRIQLHDIEPLVNAVGVTLEFSPKEIEILAIQRSHDFDFWPEVTFSNTEGYVRIEGVSLLRGLTGTISVADIVVTAKTSRLIELNISDVELYAFDGKGTPVQVSAVSALYNNADSVPGAPFATELPIPDLGDSLGGFIGDRIEDTGFPSDKVFDDDGEREYFFWQQKNFYEDVPLVGQARFLGWMGVVVLVFLLLIIIWRRRKRDGKT